MKYQVAALLFSIVGSQSVWAADAATHSNAASAEVAPLLAEMGAAANAHDVERHVGFYAHDASVVFIFNGEPTIGWEAIREKQREVWRNGTSDVVYTIQGKPTCRFHYSLANYFNKLSLDSARGLQSKRLR